MNRENYTPGPADANIARKDENNWTMVLVRELTHPPERVWRALTDPAQLREWAPFDPSRNLAELGPVLLETVGAPSGQESPCDVTRVEILKLLEYTWGGREVRWELTATDHGTRLSLWASIDRRFIAMGAAGWQLCLDVLNYLLDDEPMGRTVGMDALHLPGWQRLNAEYSEKFGVEAPKW